tara:strand:+ start:840 stop:1535 length:696 start_codon:yes stop_codon:yes gene_type:complete
MPERSSEYPIRPSEDEYGRNCCLQPKPTPSASVPYVPPTCELSSDEIDELLRMLEDYQAQQDLAKTLRGEDETEELPYPTDEQLEEMIECVDVEAMTDEQVKRFNETNEAALEDIVEAFKIAMVYVYVMQQQMCNTDSQLRKDLEEEDFELPPEIGEFCETDIEIPQSIKDIIDKILEGGDINVWDQIKINISPEARRVIDGMIGDAGNYIDKDELDKFKDQIGLGLYTNL